MPILNTEEFVSVGYIRKGHGYKGHAKLVVEAQWSADLLDQEFLFLEIDGYKVPYAIQEKDQQHDIIVKLEWIDSVEALQPFVKKEIFLLKKDIHHAESFIAQEDKTQQLLGLHIIDEQLGDLGPIIRIDEYPQQNMAILLDANKNEILIPLHPDLIQSIDLDHKRILMDLPEGLV